MDISVGSFISQVRNEAREFCDEKSDAMGDRSYTSMLVAWAFFRARY